MLKAAFAPYILNFYEPAGTSRGILTDKSTWFIKIWDTDNPKKFGLGEAAFFPGLSCDDKEKYVSKLIETISNVAIGSQTDLTHFPSIRFGLEQAILDFNSGGQGSYFPSDFTAGKTDIIINGLIWMGSAHHMRERIDEKLDSNFKCIKVKIGAIDFIDELELIHYIKSKRPDIEVRVDANGGFSMDNVLLRLTKLAESGVHSIEQPIPAGNSEQMRILCEVSPLPIALDEELIGINERKNKINLLDTIKPAFIILKPALCGGFSGAIEWIELANERNIGWWITSSLESNIGLSALSQWTATLKTTIPQGLGTGALFENNFGSALYLSEDRLRYNPIYVRDNSEFNKLDWRE